MSEMPELRAGPPWAMEEMILAEPGLVAPILASPEALEAAEWIRETETVVVTGCGTSEHAAMAGAALLGARSRDAFEASLDPQADGVLIAVSHEAGTAATLAAMEATSARTILITANPGAETGAELTVATPLTDTSWCHTVGYVSPIVASAAVAAHVTGEPLSEVGLRELLGAGLTQAATAQTEAMAAILGGIDRLIVLAGGRDRPSARELALKVEEGVHIPATMRDLETMLHGHLAGTDARIGRRLIVVARCNARGRHAAARVSARAVVEAGGVRRLIAGRTTGEHAERQQQDREQGEKRFSVHCYPPRSFLVMGAICSFAQSLIQELDLKHG